MRSSRQNAPKFRADELAPARADRQKLWLHNRGTDRLLRAVDAAQPAPGRNTNPRRPRG